MPKAYWIAQVEVEDPERYQDYVSAASTAFEKYGARFLARGGPFVPLEGMSCARNVVIEFESLDVAKACYDSPEYQHARSLREPVAQANMVLVEGLA